MKIYELTIRIYKRGMMNTRPRIEHIVVRAENPADAREQAWDNPKYSALSDVVKIDKLIRL